MSPEELDLFRLKMQVQSLRLLIEGLYATLGRASPAFASSLSTSFAELRPRYEQVVLRNLPPGYSDMLSAEFQNAFAEILTSIETQIKAKSPP